VELDEARQVGIVLDDENTARFGLGVGDGFEQVSTSVFSRGNSACGPAIPTVVALGARGPRAQLLRRRTQRATSS